jgi:2-polyprenyl-3-methyl-5-hydroxy-6-metoxy-1,4-benzoquinol methylase
MKSLPRRALNAARFRGRRAAARGRVTALALADRATGVARRSMPAPVRLRLSRAFLRPSQPATVAIERLLLGAQAGMSAKEFSAATDDLMWTSTPVTDGPHVQLLEAGPGLSDDEILASAYGQLGLGCLKTSGSYFWADSPAGVVEVARDFLARRDNSSYQPRANQSGPADPILVERIRGSEYFSVLDGHHRIALAYAAAETTVPVVIKRTTTSTSLQDFLLKMSWLDGTKELYQPVPAPELQSDWTLVRACTDRLDKMRAFLASREISPGTYLDVASCYGWFIAQMAAEGFLSEGVERDPLARPLGSAIYRLPPSVVHIGQCEEFLASAGRRWDVVSCFSLLHHFALGRGSVGPAELVELLDQVTGSVLFLDTGQEHEAWFGTSLAGWDTARIAGFLAEHGTFDEIIDLGPDKDGVGAYAGNYSRHLFACVRRPGNS